MPNYQQGYPDPYYPQQSQQILPVSSDEVYAAEMQREVIRNIISQISPDNQLYEIEMRIRGYRKEVSTGQWIKINRDGKEPHPLLVERYISFLSSILNQGTSLSYLNEKQVNMIMDRCIEFIVDDLDTNAEIYDIEYDFTERTRIGTILLNPLFMVLCRALNGRESNRVFKAISLAEYSAESQTQTKKKGILDYFKM